MLGGTTLYFSYALFWGLGCKKVSNPAFFLPFAFGIFTSGKPNMAPPELTKAPELEEKYSLGKWQRGKPFPPMC